MSTTIIVVRPSASTRCCSTCEKPLVGRRLRVQAQTGLSRMTFSVGAFCLVACLMRFARKKKKKRMNSIRGWAFGEVRR